MSLLPLIIFFSKSCAPKSNLERWFEHRVNPSLLGRRARTPASVACVMTAWDRRENRSVYARLGRTGVIRSGPGVLGDRDDYKNSCQSGRVMRNVEKGVQASCSPVGSEVHRASEPFLRKRDQCHYFMSCKMSPARVRAHDDGRVGRCVLSCGWSAL